MTRNAFLIVAALPLAACMGSGAGAGPDPAFAPVLAAAPAPAPANGAIFQVGEGYAALTSGARAARVGDIIQVQLVERTNAATQNSQSSDRSGGIGLTPPTTGILSGLISPSDVAMSGTSEFSGRGAAAQSNQLSGDIAVTVVAVHPNGVLEVRGEKRVAINRGNEYIRLSGLVRPVDIGPDNRIASTRIANAQITYSGAGEVANASRQGWLQRFFAQVSPF